MVFNDRITFVTEIEGGFNPDTGNHEESTKLTTTLPCHTSFLGIDRAVQLFGDIDEETIVIRLQRPYKATVDYAEYKGMRYNVKQHVPHKGQSVFYLRGAYLGN